MKVILKAKKLVVVCLVLSVVFLFAGCSSIAQKATETAVQKTTGVSVDKEGESVKVKGKDGESEVEMGQKLPDGFPDKFPIYEGAKVAAASKVSTDEGITFNVTFEVDRDLKEVAEYYKSTLPENGYTIKSTVEGQDSVIYELEGNGVTSVLKNEGKTMVQVTLTEGGN